MKFCTNTYLNIHKNLIASQGHRSKVKLTEVDFQILNHCNIETYC